jgi:hypothetical protein
MNDKFEFYKDFYFKELDKRNEINNSLSLPIGIITTLIAGVFYLSTNFNYDCQSLGHIIVAFIFVILVVTGIVFLIVAVYDLVKSYTDFPKGYEYFLLPDTNEIDDYEKKLQEYYSKNPEMPNTANEEVKEYILSEMIKNTGQNQVNNKRKSKFRYLCEKNLIISLMIITASFLLFIANYSFGPQRTSISEIKIIGADTSKINFNSKENRKFILEILKDSSMRHISRNTDPKPTPPPSQIIKEGQEPRPKPNK